MHAYHGPRRPPETAPAPRAKQAGAHAHGPAPAALVAPASGAARVGYFTAPGDDLFERSADAAADAVLAGRPVPPQPRHALGVQRQPISPDAPPPQPDPSLDLGKDDDLSTKNERIQAVAAQLKTSLGQFPAGRVAVTAFWRSGSVSSDDPAVDSKRESLKAGALARASTVRTSLVVLGVPADKVSAAQADLDELSSGGAAASNDKIAISFFRAPINLQLVPSLTELPPPPAPGAPLLDLGPDADLTKANPRIAETAKAIPSAKSSPGGQTVATAYLATDPGIPAGDPAWTKVYSGASDRAQTVRAALVDLGVSAAAITADVQVVPAGSVRAGHVLVRYVQPPAPAATGGSLPAIGLDKITKYKLGTRDVSLTITIPKSIDLNLALKRGIPGLTIDLKGEITDLGKLLSPPTPTLGTVTPGPPFKFTLTISRDEGERKIDATASVDTAARTVTAGFSVTIVESGRQYVVPSSVLKDIRDAGKKLQDAIAGYVTPAPEAPVGPPATPPPTSPPSTTSRIFDVVSALDTIYQAMDKIQKLKDTGTKTKITVGPTITVPYGTEPKPIFGITGTIYFE